MEWILETITLYELLMTIVLLSDYAYILFCIWGDISEVIEFGDTIIIIFSDKMLKQWVKSYNNKNQLFSLK